MPTLSEPWHIVRKSPLHGNGVFAARDIPAGTRIIEYIGIHITPEEADERHPVNPNDPFHTFYFSLSYGMVIDGASGGNEAKWINHSCAPNCETEENEEGDRVFVMALRDIAQGEELFYDYGLVLDDKITKTLKEQYRCLCGAEACRGTMLALPKKKSKKKDSDKAKDKVKDKKSKTDDKKKTKKSKDKADKKSDKRKAKST